MGAPKHIQTLRSAAVLLDTANADRTGATGSVPTLITGAATGTVVQRVNLAAVGNTTKGYIRFFLHNGTSNFFLFEIPVPEVTPGVGPPIVSAWSYTWRGSINLPSASFSLRLSTHTGDDFNAVADGGDF